MGLAAEPPVLPPPLGMGVKTAITVVLAVMVRVRVVPEPAFWPLTVQWSKR